MLKHFKMDFKILKFLTRLKTDASLIHRYRPSRRGAPSPQTPTETKVEKHLILVRTTGLVR